MGNILLNLTKVQLLSVMMEALDYMNQSNHRSRHDCIMMALGADFTENDEGKMEYSLPPLSEIKKMHT